MKRFLILCTGNSCRSIMVEALLNHHGKGRLQAHSAGSKPAGYVHPITLKVLANWGIATEGLRSKSWDEFEGQQFDAVITVCDNAKGEACPLFSGTPARAHWGVEDPALVDGPPARAIPEFERVLSILEGRVKALLALPFEDMDRTQLAAALQGIAKA